jgi:exopolysaccharide production protein ExoQ
MIVSMQRKNNLLRLFELVFTVLSLFHLSQALTPLLLTGGASEGDGADIRNMNLSLNAQISVLIYCICFLLLFLRWKKVFALFKQDKSIWLIWLLLLIVCLSYFWSAFPSETFRYSIYAIGTTGFGLYLATRYTLKEQIVIFSWTFGLIVVLSLLFCIAIPQYGTMGGVHEGAWRGIYTHKNLLGLAMVPAAIIFYLRALSSKSTSWIFWLLLASSVALLILARSSGSLANFIVMVSLCIAYRLFRWRYEFMISAILVGVIAAIAIFLWLFDYGGLDLIFTALGRDATLTGRTDIWRYSWDMIQLRPWQGYGLNAFWHGLQGPSAYVELALTVPVAYAHNGYLDMWLAIGLIGISVFFVGLFSAAAKALVWLRKTNTVEGFWPLLFLTYILLSNVAEGSITTMNNHLWAMYTATFFSLLIAARENVYSPRLTNIKKWA